MFSFDNLFLIAFIQYATVIVSHRVLQRFDRWMGRLFLAAFLTDLSATFIVCYWVAKEWKWTPHSISGVAILVLMGMHLIAYHSAERGNERFRKLFDFCSPIAGCIWVVVTVSGTPLSIGTQSIIDVCIIGFVSGFGFAWYRARKALQK